MKIDESAADAVVTPTTSARTGFVDKKEDEV
jgi:hypothetical protein